jgi:hypothetical protein
MTTCIPAPNATRNNPRRNGSSHAAFTPPPDTCPGAPDWVLGEREADRVFEARVKWFLEVSRSA